ncbi:class I lanthipeptide [Ferruginibacter sp. SUN106]|uniref:class I lanthipeptide n=1 Tax=Ferruginibacter sp. SUN106 TaxID=2978348 RepID=UPI003D35D5A4
MKPDLIKSKLQLKKQAISNLSNVELRMVNGGVAEARTTSVGNCTGFFCCEPPPTATCTCNLACDSTIYPTYTQ